MSKDNILYTAGFNNQILVRFDSSYGVKRPDFIREGSGTIVEYQDGKFIAIKWGERFGGGPVTLIDKDLIESIALDGGIENV